MQNGTLAENLVEEEQQTYQRLLRTLHDMQAQIEERVRPVAEQAVQAEIERLRSLSEQQRSILIGLPSAYRPKHSELPKPNR